MAIPDLNKLRARVRGGRPPTPAPGVQTPSPIPQTFEERVAHAVDHWLTEKEETFFGIGVALGIVLGLAFAVLNVINRFKGIPDLIASIFGGFIGGAIGGLINAWILVALIRLASRHLRITAGIIGGYLLLVFAAALIAG